MEASAADQTRDSQSLFEENRRLTEELAQCKADKEFVWSLWKQLQKESPDMTATVDMVVTREKLKSEQRNQKVMAILQAKEKEIASLKSLVDARQEESADQELRLKHMESEVTLLEKRLESQQLEVQQAATEKQEVFKEAESMKERCMELEAASQEGLQREQGLMEELSKLKGEIRENKILAQEQAEKEERIEALQEELSTLGSRMADLSSECSTCVEQCKELDLQLKLKQQQLQKEREEGKSKDSQIQRLRDELVEVGHSRDSWANHTTLQNSSVQRLQEENGQLRADVAAKEEKLSSLSETLQQLSIQLKEARDQKAHYESECHHLVIQLGEARKAGALTGELDQSTDRHQCAQGEGISGVDRMKKDLERMEGELFEARLQLQNKMEELQCLRSSHDRRLQRMQALQENHRLVLEQLRTYEGKSSPCKKSLQSHSRQYAKTLRQENSEAVWNELSHYKSRCRELEEQVIRAEEERDTLQTKCLRNQTTITELRLCLQHERGDLERKLAAVVDLESTTSTSSIQDSKVINLEKQVTQLQHEKRKLLTQLKVAEKKCYVLRESGVEMQSTIMQFKHKLQVKKLKTFSKSTMTDVTPEDSTVTPRDTSSFTDSATQVDLIVTPAKHPPKLKDTSPCLDWKPPVNLSFKEVAPSSQESDHKRSCRHTHHYRAHSDGEILLHKRRAKDALGKIQYLSRTLQQGSPRKVQEENATIRNSTNNSSLEANTTIAVESPKKEDPTQPEITGHEYAHSKLAQAADSATKQSEECSKPKKKPRNMSAAPHKCVWQQQVKSLQQRLKTLTKQVMVLSTSKQSLSQGLEAERTAREKARGEARELGQRLQSYRASVQSLQEEAQKLRETNQELQQKFSSFESEKARVCAADSGQEKRGRSDSECKKAETERKALSDKCATLSATVKSLEEQLNMKSGVLRIVQERCARFERDVKQKRQLVEDQRQKLKQAKDCTTEEQEKTHKLATEVLTLNEALGQNKHKVELLRLQLNKQAKEKEGLSAMLTKCQDELAHTLQQLSNCQEQCEKKKQMAHQMKQLFQHKEEELHTRQSEKISQLEEHLKAQQKQLLEFYQFTEMLAVDLEQQVHSRKEFKQRKGHQKAPVECGDERSSSAVSLRVREIARSAFDFSDLDIDEFFSDVDTADKQGARPCHGFVDCIKAAMSKPQFAAQLVKNFTDFIGQMLE